MSVHWSPFTIYVQQQTLPMFIYHRSGGMLKAGKARVYHGIDKVRTGDEVSQVVEVGSYDRK